MTSQEQKKSTIVLLDGHALVHRAFHAIPPLTTSSGELVNAVYGFSLMLMRVVADLKPDYWAIAFDLAGPTFRHTQYEAYKAQRPPSPPGLHEQFDRVREVSSAFGMSIYEIEGFEADDVIGTLARQATAQGIRTVIVTGDADALQLVNDSVQVLMPGRTFADPKLYDQAAVCERYGLQPGQLIDYKALKGDPSDNIPGVPGIGDKTAVALLQEFGDLKTVYANLAAVKPRQAKLLSENEEMAHLSQHLATIVTDVPISLTLDECAAQRYDRTAVANLFRELEFRALVERLPTSVVKPSAPFEQSPPGQTSMFELVEQSRSEPAPASEPAAVALGEYHTVRTPEQLEQLAQLLEVAPVISFDVETTGVDVMRSQLVGISFAVEPGKGYYLPLAHTGADAGEQLALSTVRERLGPLLADPNRPKSGHNVKFDMGLLLQHGIVVRGSDYDSLLAAYMLAPSSRGLGLKDLAWRELGLQMTPIEELIGKGKSQITMAEVMVERAAPYAGADADIALRLRQKVEPTLRDSGMWRLFAEVEMPLAEVLMRMERAGVALDLPYLNSMSDELSVRITELEDGIYQQVGHRFNLNSPAQLGTVLFEELGLPSGRKTKTGYSTEASILERLRGTHPVLDQVLEYRQLVKLKSTYVDALPSLVNPDTGRVHTSFNQAVASTGRLSSSDPNLQNIPVRTELGRRVRRAFIAGKPDHVLLSADYSQVELRILAHITGDERLTQAFNSGEDIHAATASDLFGVPLAQVDGEMRRLAKTINFGVLYGMSDYGLSQRVDLSRAEAAEYIARYLNRYTGVNRYIQETLDKARVDGYVETLMGRRRPIPEINSSVYLVRQGAERMAINAPIQGTAADIIKLAMVELDRSLLERGLESAMLLQVHDELVLEAPRQRLQEVAQLLRETMEGAFPLSVALEVEMSAGENWASLEHFDA